MQITFRPPNMDDLDELLHVEQSCFEPEERANRKDFINFINYLPQTTLIAEMDGKAVGMLIGRTTNDNLLNNDSYTKDLTRKPSDKYLGILGLAVSPDYQGLGIATQLLDRIAELAKKQELSRLILDCRERLIPFYEKHGFELLGHSNSNFGGIEWFGMQKSLK